MAGKNLIKKPCTTGLKWIWGKSPHGGSILLLSNVEVPHVDVTRSSNDIIVRVRRQRKRVKNSSRMRNVKLKYALRKMVLLFSPYGEVFSRR